MEPAEVRLDSLRPNMFGIRASPVVFIFHIFRFVVIGNLDFLWWLLLSAVSMPFLILHPESASNHRLYRPSDSEWPFSQFTPRSKARSNVRLQLQDPETLNQNASLLLVYPALR